ncbi:MAG: hypothetical protein GEV28_26030 [Actinophytocola sp.]|uniref:hypothetical protein n=1 Tax=Actinophytocola sp. TaxID=1872138 RepID=UPI00132B6F69|nr:hypothetical protein [Actinophytocola sp.]MPZ83663.1 hypothetical protein [Actinophytocola sp.]
MLIARLAVAACALLVLVGCGIGHSTEAVQSKPTSTPTAAAERSDYRASDGMRKSLGDGVLLTVSPPKSFTPTDTAYPRVPRAVAFEMVVDNGSTVPFRPAQLTFVALVEGRQAEQVIDSTQGYIGVSGTTDEVPPDESLRFAVAFAVPEHTCAVQVSVRPDGADSVAIGLYDGAV